jgi:hypothetical protein
VTNGIPLGSSLLLPVDTVNCVQTLKATIYESPLLLMAATLIEEKGKKTYLVLKNTLTTKFGTDQFLRYKSNVSEMLAAAAVADSGAHASRAAVMSKLDAIIAAADAGGEILTYTRIKHTITTQMGASVMRVYRGEITNALVRQLSRRRAASNKRLVDAAKAGSSSSTPPPSTPASSPSPASQSGSASGSASSPTKTPNTEPKPRRDLKEELTKLLERSARESFDQLRKGLTPIDLGSLAGAEIISMARTVRILGGNLAVLQQHFQKAYAQVPGLDVLTLTTRYYDSLVATEVRCFRSFGWKLGSLSKGVIEHAGCVSSSVREHQPSYILDWCTLQLMANILTLLYSPDDVTGSGAVDAVGAQAGWRWHPPQLF